MEKDMQPRITYHDNGVKSSETHYVNGKIHGKRKFWFDNGKLHHFTFYNDGKKHGMSMWYNDKGKLTSETFYENDKIACIRTYWDGGYQVLKKEVKIENDRRVDIEFFAYLQPSQETFRANKQIHTFKQWSYRPNYLQLFHLKRNNRQQIEILFSEELNVKDLPENKVFLSKKNWMKLCEK